MGTDLCKPRVMMHFFTYRLLSKGHQTEKCLEGGKNLKIFPKPMAKRTKSTSSSKVLHKLVPRRRRNSMLFYSSWWGLIDTKISQKTPTPGIDDSLFKSIVMRTPMFIPMTRTVSEFHKEKKGYNFKLFETLHFRLFFPPIHRFSMSEINTNKIQFNIY